MIRYNFDQAIDRLERGFITGELKIATGEVWQDINLLRGIISKGQLPAGHGAANAAGLIQGQTLRLGYRATGEIMLADYWRRDYDRERADGKTDQRQSGRHFSIRQTAHCI